MSAELKNHLVAFIDILGFSQMVTSDCEGEPNGQKYVDRLLAAHEATRQLGRDYANLQITQFSDSIVISAPYSALEFSNFIAVVAACQKRLLSGKILCRGGVAVGKHYSDGAFVFSGALIEAYRIESQLAIFPRIVISPDLIDLVFAENAPSDDGGLMLEIDGLWFVNYFFGTKSEDAEALMEELIPAALSKDPSIRNKQIWMIEYYNYCFPDKPIREISRFAIN